MRMTRQQWRAYTRGKQSRAKRDKTPKLVPQPGTPAYWAYVAGQNSK